MNEQYTQSSANCCISKIRIELLDLLRQLSFLDTKDNKTEYDPSEHLHILKENMVIVSRAQDYIMSTNQKINTILNTNNVEYLTTFNKLIELNEQ